jgi:hypothetical protein
MSVNRASYPRLFFGFHMRVPFRLTLKFSAVHVNIANVT